MGTRGKKICECGTEVGARTRVCSCGYEFYEKRVAEPKKVVVVEQSPGEGRKQCSCGFFMNSRIKFCPTCNERVVCKPKERKAIEQVPGPGRKQCACGVFVALRIKICPSCNQEIVTKPKEPKEVKPVEQSPGIGRKQCVCELFVGGRTGICPSCGHVFVPGERQEREKKERAARKAEKAEIQRPMTRAEKFTQQLLKQFYDNPPEVLEMKGLTADDHAHRVLGLGEERAGILLFQHKTKQGESWSHVNWKLVEEQLTK